MNELARHLTHEGSHGDLPFHPSCPTCREERLSGLLPARPLVSARAQAGLAAAVLAGSAAVPAVAAATPPVPEEETSAEGTQDPGDAPLPDIDSGPLESSVPDDGADDDSLPPGAEVAPQGPDAVVAPPIAAPPAPATPAPGAPAAPAPPAPATEVADTPAKKRPAAKRRDAASAPQVAPAREVPAVPQPPVAPIPATTETPAKGGRHHVVQAGESLWTIARVRLGAGATPAEIAREVKRIWDLNADAIGTGDPDLVMAGQKLRLR